MKLKAVQDVLNTDRVAYFDVDNTLIIWEVNQFPFTMSTVIINGREFGIHKAHLKKIKDYATMGFLVIVWSNSGHQWAKQVAEALGIEKLVYTTSKPHRVFDDQPLNETIKSGYIELKGNTL